MKSLADIKWTIVEMLKFKMTINGEMTLERKLTEMIEE